MNVKIQAVNFDASQPLITFIEEKLAKFGRFSDKITNCEVTLKIEKDDQHGNKSTVIEVSLPGDKLVAESKSIHYEESVDNCIDALKKQLDKYKAKNQ